MSSIRRLLPKRSLVPICTIVFVHALVWLGTKALVKNAHFTELAVSLDRLMPLREEWVVIYVLTYLFWIMGLLLIARQEEALGSRMAVGVIIADIICGIFFLALPTTVARPELTVDGPFSWALSVIYALDTPTNCFPSMHCLFAYLVFRQSLDSPSSGTGFRIFCGVFTLLVFMSTLFVKQHVIADVVSGVFFAEAAYILGQKLPFWKIFIKINKKLLQNAP